MMRRLSTDSLQKAFLVLLLLLLGVSFLNSPGTGDRHYWNDWVKNAGDLGVVRGFAANNLDYPPLTALFLFAGVRLFSLTGAGQFLAIKATILLFLVLTTFLFWLWTRRFWLAVALYVALLLDSVLLTYVDVLILPWLILALWALQRRRLLLFTLLFGVACLTKWPPLIIAPFIALYILNVQGTKGWRRIDWKAILLQVLLPGVAVVALVVLVYGAGPLLLALQGAFAQPWLSGDAMNFNWIITHWLHVHRPDQYGPLVDGLARNIMDVPREITLWPTLLHWFLYVSALVAYLWRRKTFESLIFYALVGYLAYHTFAVGVHENHLFLAVVLACVLAWLNPRARGVALVCILMLNANLVLFYGLQGEPVVNRVVGGVDVALVFSILMVAFALGMWIAALLPRREAADAAPGTAGPGGGSAPLVGREPAG
jgi:hypothetical protein